MIEFKCAICGIAHTPKPKSPDTLKIYNGQFAFDADTMVTVWLCEQHKYLIEKQHIRWYNISENRGTAYIED